MRYPKGFQKWTLDEQEKWLSVQRSETLNLLEKISRQLAKVRGGMKIQPQTEVRPDLEYA